MTETHPDPIDTAADAPPPSVATASAPGPTAEGGTGRSGVLVPLLAVTAALGWAYWAVLRSLWTTWVTDPNYSHGFLVIPVAALIAWRRRDLRASGESTRPWPLAWVFLVGVLAARAYLYERGNHWAEAVTMLPTLACLALAYGGRGLLRKVWPAIGFLIFMLPLPAAINGLLARPLQSLATVASCAVLKFTGLWVISEGNIIFVGKQPLEVATACNGLSMLMCLSATVVATVLLVPMAPWLRVVLALSAAPIALASNVLRIVATAWCYHRFGPEVGARVAHDGAGWLMMPLALVLVGVELWLINSLVTVEVAENVPMILGRPITKVAPRPPLASTGRHGPATDPDSSQDGHTPQAPGDAT